jgi:hypothetical protein
MKQTVRISYFALCSIALSGAAYSQIGKSRTQNMSVVRTFGTDGCVN